MSCFGRAYALVLWCALAPASALAEPAQARSAEDRAKECFTRGQEHFTAGRYGDAIREYEAGYQLSRLPGFLLNIAHSYRRQGDFDNARTYYKRFLLMDPTSQSRADVEAVLVELDEVRPGQVSPPAEPVRLTPSPPTPAGPAPLLVENSPPASEEPRPILTRWYFWAGVGLVVAAGVTATLLLSARGGGAPPKASLGTLRR